MPIDIQDRAEIRMPYTDLGPLVTAARGVTRGVHLDFRFVPDDEMNAMLELADVVVFPYREIDISGVLMTALRHGRPIIASRIGGFAELLVDGRHGTPDDPAAFAAAMTRLCASPEARGAMGPPSRG